MLSLIETDARLSTAPRVLREFLMTSQHELRDRVIGMVAQCRRDRPGCLGGFRPVAQTVNDPCKVTIRGRHQDVCIA